MLQRIQTVYLLMIVALMGAVLFMPLATLHWSNLFYKFDVSGIITMGEDPEMIYSTWALFALNAVIIFVALITIFLFRKRILQIRLCVFNALLMIGFYALFGFYYWNMTKDIGDISFNFKIALVFPLITIILDYLAIRNIGADEALVRSLERLR